MSSVDGAVSLGRALLSLLRAEQTGVMDVRTELGACRLVVVDGVPRGATSLPSADRTLGDALVSAGELDRLEHARALAEAERDAFGLPIGAWLVASGLASERAVASALRRQLRERIVCVLGCERIDYRFEARPIATAVALVQEAPSFADLVLEALRARVGAWSQAQVLAAIPDGELRLNARGRAWMRAAALWPEETVALVLLEHGSTLSRVMQASRGSARASVLLAILALFSAVAGAEPRERGFSLLARKQMQLRRRAAAHALLDLPEGAPPAEGRRALRRLARSLHPDALGPHAGPALRAASSEVMGALIAAERELRAASR